MAGKFINFPDSQNGPNIYTIYTQCVREQCSADCNTLQGNHGMDRLCHMLKDCSIMQIVTCDSIFTTQMIQRESTVLTENNTFDVYALSL